WTKTGSTKNPCAYKNKSSTNTAGNHRGKNFRFYTPTLIINWAIILFPAINSNALPLPTPKAKELKKPSSKAQKVITKYRRVTAWTKSTPKKALTNCKTI